MRYIVGRHERGLALVCVAALLAVSNQQVGIFHTYVLENPPKLKP